MHKRPSSGASIGVKWPGAAFDRNIVQYLNARSLRATACGHSMSPALGAGTTVVRGRFPGLPAAILAATDLGFLPRCAMALRCQHHLTLVSDLDEALAAVLQRRQAAGERLPPADCHIDVAWIEFDGVTASSGHLSSNDRRARAAERLIDRLPSAAVVLDRAAHAFDRLLSSVHRLSVLGPTADLP